MCRSTTSMAMAGESSTTSMNMAGEFSTTSMAMVGEFRSLRSCIPSVDMTGEHNSLLS